LVLGYTIISLRQILGPEYQEPLGTQIPSSYRAIVKMTWPQSGQWLWAFCCGAKISLSLVKAILRHLTSLLIFTVISNFCESRKQSLSCFCFFPRQKKNFLEEKKHFLFVQNDILYFWKIHFVLKLGNVNSSKLTLLLLIE
jgi:hypothetical protein